MNRLLTNSPGARLALALLGAVILMVPAGASAQGIQPLPPSQAPAALVTAIDAHAATLGGTYLGKDCSQAVAGTDGGKWCWSLLQLSDACAEVGFARANSDTGAPAVTFARAANGTWAPGSCSPQPPATGTGLATVAASSNGPMWSKAGAWLAALGALGLFVTRKARAASSRVDGGFR